MGLIRMNFPEYGGIGASLCAFASVRLSWHFAHWTEACFPSRGNLVLAWLKRGVCFQDDSLWQSAHLLPS